MAPSIGVLNGAHAVQGLAAAAVNVTSLALEGPQLGWSSTPVLGGVVVCVAGLAAFGTWEMHAAEPMMDVHLFRNRTYSLAIVTIFVTMFSVYGMLLLISQLWQNVLAYSVLTTGLLLLPLAVIQTVASPIAGRLVPKVGARHLVLVGLSLLTAALTIQTIGIGFNEALVVVGVAMVGAGQAFTMTPATAVAMAAVPDATERDAVATEIIEKVNPRA